MQRGEIYFVSLDPIVGREQGGYRPVLIISTDAINQKPLVVTIVPGTDGANVKRDYPSTVRLPPSETGLPNETVFLCFQVRALDPSRFPAEPVGCLSADRLQDIDATLRYCLEL